MKQFKVLLGKVIKKVHMIGDNILIFEDLDRLFFFKVLGECCSSSWVEHFAGIENLLNSTILDAEAIPLKDIADNEDECLKFYSFKFRTDKGYIDIEFRNSSNGYYGALFVYEPDLTSWDKVNTWLNDRNVDEPIENIEKDF